RRLQIRPAMAGRTEAGHLAARRLVIGIDLRTSGPGVEALEDVLFDVRLAFDELDPVARPLEKVQITAAREVDETLDRPAVALVIDQDRRRHFVAVPRFVRRVLEM